MKAVGTVSNGAMTLYTINPNIHARRFQRPGPHRRADGASVLQRHDATDRRRATVGGPTSPRPSDRGSGSSRCRNGALGRLRQGDGHGPHRRAALYRPGAEGAHVITDSRQVFGGPLTQITLLAGKQTKDKNPILFQAVANALEAASAAPTPTNAPPPRLGRRCTRPPKPSMTSSPSSTTRGFEFTARPQRIAHFTALLHRLGTLKTKVADWKQLLWAHHQAGD